MSITTSPEVVGWHDVGKSLAPFQPVSEQLAPVLALPLVRGHNSRWQRGVLRSPALLPSPLDAAGGVQFIRARTGRR